MHIEKLSRFPLAQLPTPLEALPRLSRELGGPELLIKRDDQTGLAFGALLDLICQGVFDKGEPMLF